MIWMQASARPCSIRRWRKKLFDAEAKLAEYEKNMDVYILRGLLQEITDEKNVTESEKQFVQKAEELYEGMEPELKKLVTKEERRKLTVARKSLATNERAAKKVSNLIASSSPASPRAWALATAERSRPSRRHTIS
ncbi:MAG: hypothetical protein ACLR8U_01645 [Oscillospiraceae bacterium]